jgi:hypothetical protein
VIPLVALVSICAVFGLFTLLLFIVASAPTEERPLTVDRDNVYEEGA